MKSSSNLSKRLFDKRALVGLLLVIVLFRFGLYLGSITGFQKIELGLVDSRFRRYGGKFALQESPIVIVDIDDASYEALPLVWPWPRSYYARLIRNLNRAGAKLIGLDVMFEKPKPDHPAGDDSLANALARHDNVILAAKAIAGEGLNTFVLPYARFINPKQMNWAIINVGEDADGVVREYPTGAGSAYDSIYYPSFAVKLFAEYTGKVPPVKDERFRIAYPGGTKTFLYRPFYQVIDDATLFTKGEAEWEEEVNWFDSLLLEDVFRNKIVLVGASLVELHDTKITPFSASDEAGRVSDVPGVEVHAAALHTLLNGYQIAEANLYITYIALAVLCFLLLMVGMFSRFWIHLPVIVLTATGWVVVSYQLYSQLSILVPIVSPLLCLVLVSAGQQGYLFYLEQGRRKTVTGMFGHYVPKEVVSELIRNPSKMRLGGERRELTVLFSDVQGFTTISEQLSPEQLVELLNAYLTAMTAVIHQHGGIIDKYEGDAIMAEFGIPLVMPDHAAKACRAAFAMQKRLQALRDEWIKKGKPELRARIGIGSGPMVFGNMGSDQAFDYTVMGDVVNLASRLEGANKEYGTWILVNERTFELCGNEILAREIDRLRVKGKTVPVKCFELLGVPDSPEADEIREVITLFEQGLNRYRDQEWEQAIVHFRKVMEIWKDDGPSEVYIRRCESFMRRMPGKDWDGVFTMRTK